MLTLFWKFFPLLSIHQTSTNSALLWTGGLYHLFSALRQGLLLSCTVIWFLLPKCFFISFIVGGMIPKAVHICILEERRKLLSYSGRSENMYWLNLAGTKKWIITTSFSCFQWWCLPCMYSRVELIYYLLHSILSLMNNFSFFPWSP